MLSVGDSSQPDSSESVKDGAFALTNERSNCYSASLSGERNYSILIYGPQAMREEISEIIMRNQLGARIDSRESESDIRNLLTARSYDLLVYHASKRESLKSLRSERMPASLEAVLLGYGVGFAYPEETIRQCRDEFEVRLLEKLKRE